MASRGQLARIERVRSLQLALARASEAQALAHAQSETALGTRIAQLAAATAPTTTSGDAFGLSAAAFYRDRLQQAALAAEGRVRVAQDRAAGAAEATRSAERDAKAVEKLRARADAEAVLAEIRTLENVPATRRAFRHETC